MIKLINGDCLEIMNHIPDGEIDAIITDPHMGLITKHIEQKEKN